MPRHLKTRIISRLKGAISYFVPHSDVSATHARGVRYCVFVEGINGCFGKMNTFKEGRKYQKHIIVRRWSRNKAVHQIYTYRFPKTWSAACVANREMIKEAQRRAHALEKDAWRPRMRSFSSPLRRAYNSLENRHLQPPDLQHIIFYRKIPRTTEEFAHVKKKQYLCTGF